MEWKTVLLMCVAGCHLASSTCWNNSLRHDNLQLNDNLPRRYGELNPELILTGPLYQMGDYTTCLYKFDEQYCLTEVEIKSANNSSQLWQKIQELTSVRTNFRRDHLYVGLCVPAQCSNSEVIEDFSNYLAPAAEKLGVTASVLVKKGNCQIREKPPLQTLDYAAGIIILGILIMVLSGTSYDAIRRLKNCNESLKTLGGRLLISFSMISNGKRLVTFSESQESKSFQGIQGIRAISMYLVICSHVVYIAIQKPLKNPEFFEEKFHDVFGIILFLNGQVTMGTFFFISGLLMAFFFLKNADAHGSITLLNISEAILFRYLRLTPVYAMTILLQVTWFNRLGSGPLWPSMVTAQADICRDYWWKNLLYLNDYVYPLNACLLHTWYLAADFQCYIASLFVLIPVWKYPRYAKMILAGVLAFWIVVPFVQTYVEELDPVLMSTLENIKNFPLDRTFHRRYSTFHGNAGAYTVGVISGYFHYKAKRDAVRRKKEMFVLVWAIFMIVPLAVMILPAVFYQPHYKHNVLIASAFASTEKVIWAAGIGTLITGMTFGYAWIANVVLSWKSLQVLGRISYTVYLVHVSMLFLEAGMTMDSIYVSEYSLFQAWLANIVTSTGMALVLVFLVELPTSALIKTLLSHPAKQQEEKMTSNKDQMKILASDKEESNATLLEERVQSHIIAHK